MHGREKSDFAIVAGKPTNKAVPTAAEPVERRAGPRGTRASKARTGHSAGCACHKRWSAYGTFRRHTPKAGAVCGNSARTDLGGGRSEMAVPTALSISNQKLIQNRGLWIRGRDGRPQIHLSF